MKNILKSLAIIVLFASPCFGEGIKRVSLPLEVKHEMLSVPKEIEGKIWNRWTTKNFTVCSLNDAQAQYLHKRLELVNKGILARLPYLELEQEYLEYQQRLTVQKSELEKARSALKTDQAKRRQVAAEFRRDVLGQLSETRKQAATVRQELIKASDRSRLQTLTTPVDGVVQQLAVHTVGGVVTPAQELMVIVPANSGLEIEAMILNKDKAWVTTKQDAEIKVESFPFTKFGTIDGKVAIVSGDAVQDENLGLVYPIRVTMAKTTILSGSEHVTLSPGMNVTIEVKTGKRRLIEYLLAPLQRYQDESMRER